METNPIAVGLLMENSDRSVMTRYTVQKMRDYGGTIAIHAVKSTMNAYKAVPTSRSL